MTRNEISAVLMLTVLVCASCPAAGEAPSTRSATAAASAGAPDSRPASQPAPAGPLLVEYVFSPTCDKCREAREIVETVERRYAPRIQVLRYDISEEAGDDAASACEKRHGLKPAPPPAVYVGRRYLRGLEDIRRHLDAVVAEELASGQAALAPQTAPGAGDDDRWKDRLTVGAVVAGGLVDGVNPCAFTTIIFFLSMLAYLKRSRREMVIVSAAFIVTVFVTYLLLGLGLLLAVKIFAVQQGISRGLTYAVAAFTFVLAAWSFFDAFRIIRSGKTPKMALGLPKSIKQTIHKVIREGLKTRGLVWGAMTVGFLVTLLESLCTGQVYFPITLMLKTRYWLQAMGFLLLYNAMFILPLVVLTALSLLGVSSRRLGDFMGARVGLSKVALGILFTGLGVLLLVTA